MSRTIAYTRFEVLRTLRNARFVALTMAMPTLLYLLISQVDRGSSALLMVSMAAFSMINAAISANSGSLPAERASGWLRQLRTTPLSRTGWLVARLAPGPGAGSPGPAAAA